MKRLLIALCLTHCLLALNEEPNSPLHPLRIARFDEVDTAQLARLTYTYCACAGFVANLRGNTTRTHVKNNIAGIAGLTSLGIAAVLAAPNNDRADLHNLLSDLAHHQLPHMTLVATAGYLTGAFTARFIARPLWYKWWFAKKIQPAPIN